MNDDLDVMILERFAALEHLDGGTARGWADVERRAHPLAASGSFAVARRRRFRTAGAIGLASGFVAAIVALLVITGNREDTTADDGRIRTAKTVVISNAGQSEQVQTELVIDFERQVARFTGQPSLSSPDDPIAAVTISTPTRVYLQVPEPLRTRSKGKPWVAGPTIRDQVDELFDIGRLTDPERHLNEGPQGRVVRLGEEQIDGQQLVKFEIIDSVLPEARFFYWVDTFGRLARTQQEATSRGPGPIATATITYNEPADITIPDETAVFAVATADEADDVIRPSR